VFLLKTAHNGQSDKTLLFVTFEQKTKARPRLCSQMLDYGYGVVF